MFWKTVSAILVSINILGCNTPPLETAWPELRPLGKDLPHYQTAGIKKNAETSQQVQFANQENMLSLRKALALALLNNPQLVASSFQVRAREAQALQAGLCPNPSVKVAFSDFLGNGTNRDIEALETSLQLSQLIELGGKAVKRVRVASMDRDLAAWDYEKKRLEVLTQTTQAYIEVLAAQEKLKLCEELKNLVQQVLRIVTARVRAGKVFSLEEKKTRIALAGSQLEWKQAQIKLEETQRRLGLMWGNHQFSCQGVKGDIYQISAIPEREKLEARLAQNPEVARWQTELEKRRAIIAWENSRAIPDIEVSAGINIFNETDDYAFTAAFTLPLPLFNRNQGNYQAAVHQLHHAQKEKDAVTLAIHGRLAEAYQNLKTTFLKATAMKNQVLPEALDIFKIATRGYRRGKFNYLEVLDAQRTLFQLKAQYIDTLASYHKAVAEVESLAASKLDLIYKK